MTNRFAAFILLSGLTIRPVMGLDIPLEGGTAASAGMSIGYVDMDRIFQLYPQTQFAKEDYSKQLTAKRAELAKREADLINVKNRLAVLQGTLKDLKAAPDSEEPVIDENTEAKPPRPPESIAALKKELEDKEVEYQDARKRAAEELANFEKRQSQVILGKLYQALKDLAEEEQITIVVDKSSILYGAGDIDLTERLQNKVRGY